MARSNLGPRIESAPGRAGGTKCLPSGGKPGGDTRRSKERREERKRIRTLASTSGRGGGTLKDGAMRRILGEGREHAGGHFQKKQGRGYSRKVGSSRVPRGGEKVHEISYAQHPRCQSSVIVKPRCFPGRWFHICA